MEPINKNLVYSDLYLSYDLSNIPSFPLPEGYHFVPFQSGDEKYWAEIETSAGEFDTVEDGVKGFYRSMGKDYDRMSDMCFFIENEMNEKVATGTAYYVTPMDGNITGKVHWIAIKKEYQGSKLSKPLISEVLRKLKENGHERTILHTQTYTWLATKIYLDMGFVPYCVEEKYLGWQIIKYLTHHPSLESIKDIDKKFVFKPKA